MLASVSVEGRSLATVFSSTGDVPPMLKKLLDDAGLEPQALPMDRAGDPSSWSGADLVVLADARLASSARDDTGQAALVDWVQAGGGLLVTGGERGRDGGALVARAREGNDEPRSEQTLRRDLLEESDPIRRDN